MLIVRNSRVVHSYTNINLPAVSNHAHPLCLGLAVETRALLQVLLASDTLGVAEPCLSESINVTPS